MFTFGFGAIFALTQLPGLPCLQSRHWAVRVVPSLVCTVVYVVTYVLVEKWTKPYVVLFIPMAEYLGAIGLNVVMWGVLRVLNRGATVTADPVDPEKNISEKGSVTDDEFLSSASRLGLNTTRLSPQARSQRTAVFTAVFLICVIVTIIFSIFAQTLEVSGSKMGGLTVYGPMFVLMPLSLFAARAALPFPINGFDTDEFKDGGIDPESVRGIRPGKRWTRCC